MGGWAAGCWTWQAPRPEIEDTGGCVTECVRHGQFVPPPRRGGDLLERQELILALLGCADDGPTLREIHAQLAQRASERQVRRALAVLRDRGLVVATGPGPAARWTRVRDL